jgi:1,4-dihydroxy-2-naphthoyl-CoA hydrolase
MDQVTKDGRLLHVEHGGFSLDYVPEKVIEYLNNNREGSVWEALGIQLVVAEKERLVATMTIGPNHRQQLGYLHGGISVVLAESLASMGSVLNIDPRRQTAFGLEINANHVRPKREGTVTGVAEIVALGRTSHVWDIKISDECGKLICVSRCTVAIVDRPPDDNDFVRGLIE